jgi:hypothetical protein
MTDNSDDAPSVNKGAHAPQILDPSTAISLQEEVQAAKDRGWLQEDLNRFFRRKGIDATLYRNALQGGELQTSDQRAFLVSLSVTGLPVAPHTPNPADIAAHIEWLIAPARGDYDDALIEIAYDGPGRGPTSARLFSLDEIDAAIKFAAEQNLKRSNIYIGAALRLPDSDRSRRCSSNDFYVATAVPIDIDKNYDDTRARMATICHDGLVVATGMTPERRSQHWARLVEPCDDDIEFGLAFAGLVTFTGADMAVKDSARIMRLGGTVSYPNERKIDLGYCTELTAVTINKGAEPIAIEALKAHSDGIHSGPKTERPQGASTGAPGAIEYGGKFGTIVVNGRETWWRTLVLKHLSTYQAANGADPTVDEIWETAYPEYLKTSNNDDERWTSPAGQKELRHRVSNTIRRLRSGRLIKQGLYSIETGVGKDEAEATRAEPASEPPTAQTIFDPWERYPVPNFPLDMLPKKLAAFVRLTSQSTGGDINAVAMSALTACSAALSQEFRLKMKRSGTWHVPPRLWTLLVGDPSSKKTPIIQSCVAPLRRAEKIEVDRYKKAFARWQSDKKDKDNDAGEEPKKPIRYVINSITTEKLGDILARQDRGALVEQDEVSGWIGAMDKYSGGKGGAADRAFWLQAYSGGPMTVDRLNRGEIFIDNLCVSFLGGIQPNRLSEMGDLTSDGLLQRFFPVMMHRGSFPQEVEDEFAQSAYSNLITNLSARRPTTIRASAGALDVFEAFQREVFDLERTDGLGEHFCSFVGKLTGMQGSLALTLHMLSGEDAQYDELSADAASAARTIITDFVIPHALEFYGATLDKGDWACIRSIASYLITSDIMRFTPADFGRAMQDMRGLSTAEIAALLAPLIAGGWLVEDPKHVPAKAWFMVEGVRELLAERRAEEAERRKKTHLSLQEIRRKGSPNGGENGPK